MMLEICVGLEDLLLVLMNKIELEQINDLIMVFFVIIIMNFKSLKFSIWKYTKVDVNLKSKYK